MPETLKKMRARHNREERELVREALKASDCQLGATTKALGVVKSTCQSLIKRHGLTDWYERRSPGAGRPKSAA